MIQQLLTFSGPASAWFDRAYYENHHIPLVLEIGRPLGLVSMQALYPSSGDGALIAVAVTTFTDEDAARSLFPAPRFHKLVEDQPRHTGILPEQNMVSIWPAA